MWLHLQSISITGNSWKGFGCSWVDGSVLLGFVVQETKIKVWSMYSPTSEGELKSSSKKYAFAINNSHE